jgi:D-alanyl-D-alanine carboxypeptidase
MTGAVAGLLLSLGMIAPSVPAVAATGYDIDSASSLQVVVNKHRQLDPVTYVPSKLVRVQGERLRAEAADAYKQFAQAGKSQGINVVPVSGYRSYSQQASLYDSYVAQYGQATADTLAARPGYSEHQTGLTLDITTRPETCSIQACFGQTPQGRWLAANAYRFGYILRYPADKTPITGYIYEPWHFRYVGVELATEMHETNVTTLEEFFGLPPAPDYAP